MGLKTQVPQGLRHSTPYFRDFRVLVRQGKLDVVSAPI